MRGLVLAVAVSVAALSGAASAQAPGAYTVEPFAPQQQITINGTGVRLRAEPFTSPQTQVLSSGSTGLPLTVVGIARQADWNWYQVILKNGQKAFIRSDLTSAPSRGEMLAGAPAVRAPLPPASPAPSYAPPAYTTPVAPAAMTTPLPPAPVPPAYNPAPYSPVPVQPAPLAPVSTLPPPVSTQPAPVTPAPATPPQSQPARGGAIWLTPPASPATSPDSLQSRPPGR